MPWQDVMTAAVECGFDTLLFPEELQHLGKDWQQVASFKQLYQLGTEIIDEDGSRVRGVVNFALASTIACHIGVMIDMLCRAVVFHNR